MSEHGGKLSAELSQIGRKLKPLPKELSKDSSETTCSFCGVSYMVLHEVEELKSRISQLEAELGIVDSKYLKRLQEKDIEISRLEQDLEQKDTRLESSRDEIKRHKDTIANLRDALDKIGDLNQSSQSELKDTLRTVSRQTQAIRTLESFKDAALLFNDQVREHLKALQDQVRSTQADIKLVSKSNSRILNAYQEKISQYQSDIVARIGIDRRFWTESLAAKDHLISNLHSDIDKLNDDRLVASANHEGEVRELKNEVDRHCSDISRLTTDNQTLHATVDELRRELTASSARMLELQSEKSSCEARMIDVNQDHARAISELVSRNVSLESTQEQLIAELGSKQREIEAVRALDQDSNSRISSLETLRTDLSDRVQILKNQLRVSQLENERTAEELVVITKKLGSEIQDLQSKLKMGLSSQLEEQEAAVEAIKAEHRENIVTLSSQNEALSIELVQKTRDHSAISAKLEAAESAMEELVRKNRDLESNLNDLRTSHLTEISEFKSQLGFKDDTVARLRETSVLLKQEIKDLKDKCTNLEDQLATSSQNTSSSSAEIDGLRSQLKKCEITIGVLQRTIRNECAERTDLMRLVAALRSKIADLASEKELLEQTQLQVQPQPTQTTQKRSDKPSQQRTPRGSARARVSARGRNDGIVLPSISGRSSVLGRPTRKRPR
eukprot:gnl/Dysnectes_brevis/7557_a12793_283.p1 GENE.gnl/Dysnectes_brevis/7557_a12793_283~~gnl/Dysnectes_brevis/7557_a12793_283.p1  ORF type:complete len:673 (-),score=81.77 gnl/Dysnectes_brevis/7557_a12793_283:62-2080(-)